MSSQVSVSTVTIQNIVDISQTFGQLNATLNGNNPSQPALTIANDVMNAILATAFPWKWNELILPVFYTNSYQQDYAVVNPAGQTGTLTLSAVAATVNGTAIYTYSGGLYPSGANNAYAGLPFVVAGFVNGVNNGTFMCVQSNSTQLLLKNTGAVLETHAGTAISAASSVTNLGWLERGIVIDINNSAIPKPFRTVEVGRQLQQATGTLFNSATGDPLFLVNFFPNYMLYYGVWGQPNIGGTAENTGFGMLGNNPIAGSVYLNPLGQNSQPANPITQIQDANGNFLLLTTYGTEGTTAPVAPAGATPGTTVSGSGATTVWTVLDPSGYGFRILPVPSQTGNVWQFNLVGQMKPVRFVSLSQTIAPLSDDMEPHFRQGFIAQLYRYSPEDKVAAKFPREWQLWLAALNNMRAKEDRELEENRFVPARGVMGGTSGRNAWRGAAWPYNYPGASGGY